MALRFRERGKKGRRQRQEHTIQDRAKAINTSWHRTTDTVLETARLCADAEQKLRPADKNKLFKELDFNKATFSKLAGQKHINRVDWSSWLQCRKCRKIGSPVIQGRRCSDT